MGPTVRGPNVRGPNVRGPTVRGPTVRGPTVRGPIRLEPLKGSLGELEQVLHLNLGKEERVLLQLLKREALPQLLDSMDQDPEPIVVIPGLERRKRVIREPTGFPLLPPQHLNGGARM